MRLNSTCDDKIATAQRQQRRIIGAERPADGGEQPLLAQGFRDYSGDARQLLRTGRLTGEDDDLELGCQSRQVLQDFAARHDRHRQIVAGSTTRPRTAAFSSTSRSSTTTKGVTPPCTTYHPTSSSRTYPQSPLEGVRFSGGASLEQGRVRTDVKKLGRVRYVAGSENRWTGPI